MDPLFSVYLSKTARFSVIYRKVCILFVLCPELKLLELFQ